ncbi:MAG: hypothetical protein DPW18_00980 [Chloroflexi bacterium]|nr:hypothetical protein [Chloroflexota bacterium]MDL1941383.1 hypothetical protein [Chloroflexi bacterium CFX2]
MKQKFLLAFSILTILSLSACGGAAPTLTAEEIAYTAVAQAWLAITQTQAVAPPTSTPVPPTTAPLFTDTVPAPTLEALPILPTSTAVVVASPTAQCNQIPVAEPKGALVTVEFKNESPGSANLAFGMNSPNDKGECFTYSFSIGKGDVVTSKVAAGCYWGYAWITADEPSVARSGGNIYCLTDTTKVYHITILEETIVSN